MDLENGASNLIDNSLVPEHLAALIPLVRKWGIEGQEEQDEFVTQMQRHRPAETVRFNRMIDLHRKDIIDWGRGLAHLKKAQLSDAEEQHPYWKFLAAINVRDLTDNDLPGEE
ncbi:hypothetical protein NA78x_005744 [Anatilimnocola sp. NA78]|uniref:hypothetical protein n=1 Tax=Anatilimnocola sp. NA78 TaxID=3415683 RepID=UPI003CE58CBC